MCLWHRKIFLIPWKRSFLKDENTKFAFYEMKAFCISKYVFLESAERTVPQWSGGLATFTAEGLRSIPGRGTKISQVVSCGQKERCRNKLQLV